MSKTNINPNENPIRRQSSLGGNVQFRDTGNLTENYGIFLAYVTHVYYQTGMIDFDTRDTLENVVNTNLAGGVGQAPIPVETFGTNADGKVYGNYRPINVGDKVAIAYINGDRHSPLVLGVYPKNSDSYELVSPAVYNKAGKLTEETQTTALAERKIYPSQQLYYQSGKGDILRSLGGKSFLAISEDELDLTQDLDYAYDAVGAFYDNAGEQLTSSQQKAQSWVLVHEDNPEASNADGHRTRFYVAKDGTMQIVFTNDNQLGILILEGSLDKGFTITKQYDTKVIDPKDGEDKSNKYVSLSVGGEAGFNLDVQGVSGGLNRSAKNGTNFQVRTDDLYIDNVSLTELIGKNADDIQHIIDQNQKYNKEYFDQLDKDTKHAGQVARDAAEDAAKAGSRAHDAGEKAKRTAKDIKNRIMYYMNISPEEDVYVPNKYLIIHTDTFIEDATIKKGMIDDLAVGTAQIAYEAVGTAEIEDLAVETGKIKNLAVTDEKVGELTFSHMIGETIDANIINVVNLHGENITAGTITADKIIINGLGDLSHHLGDITDGHIHAGDGGVDIDDLPADDPDQWTPFKKAWLKQQIAILEAEANSSIQYGENVGISADKVAQAKDNLINGTAPLLTNMTKTERFSMKTIQAWMDAVKQAVEDFKNLSMNSLHRKIGETVSGNSIYQGTEEPEGEMHLGDMWFKEHEDGTTETLVYGENGWYSPNDYTVSQVQDQVSKLPNSYYQADEPQGELKKDDVWYQTDTDSNGNLIYKQYRYDGKKWQPLLDDNANKNTSDTSAPANPHDGDFWTNTATNELNQWSDSKHDWVVIPTQGPQGVPGNDGQSTYFHIAYADDIQGNGFSQTPGNKKYIGTYVDNSEHDSENKADYSWNKVQGDQGKDGTDGIAGVNGVDGKTSYFHIAYADKEDGTGFSQEPANKRFMGTYVDFTQKDSIDPNKYNWTLIKGTDGANGKDGVNGSSSYIHTAYAKSSDGKDGFSTSYFKGAPYIGIVTDYVKEDPTSYISYNWSRLTGTDGTNGTNGAPGKDGEDGTTYYVHFAYANSADGKDKFSTSEFANALYIGILTNSTQEDSTNYADYTWSRLRGQDGSNGRDGTPGTNGKNGVSSYIHVAYANSADGKTGFSTEDASGKKYIGTYTDMVESDSVDPTKYNWTLIKGTDGTNGTNGIDGKPGADGKTPYVHFAYANSADGKTGFSTTYFNNALFVGTLTDYTQADSTKYTEYTWSRLRGQDGTQGPAGSDGTNGKDGSDGKTYYTWIKFATSESGANMSDVPAGMSYIGFAYNKETATESSVATDYKWTKFVGADGKPGTNGKNGSQGVKGDPGKDGRPSYTWVKYADSPTSGMSDDPTNKEYMGISTNHDTATESTKYTDYSWVRLYDKSKKRNFTGTPTTPYDVGDTWMQSGATLYCIKARQSGAFSASDWNTQQITLTSLDTALQQQVKAGTDAKDGLNSLEVGGRNLLLKSDEQVIDSSDYPLQSYELSEQMDSSETYTATVWGNLANDSTFKLYLDSPFGVDNFAVLSEISKGVYRATFKGYNNGKTEVRLYPYPRSSSKSTVNYIKLEKGNKATDWTPAPEDLVYQHKDYKGVTLNDSGLTATAGSTQVALNSSDGFLIKKGSSTLFNADTSGNLNMQGNITAGNISGVNFTGNNLTLAGSLKTTGSLMSGNGKVTLSNTGLNIKGAGLTIGDSSGKTTTMISEDGTFTANKAVLSGSLTSNSVNITGGTINMNGGAFSVDKSGNVVAKHFTATGTSGAINAGLINNGTLDFGNIRVKNLKADNIQTGTLTGITIQGNTIISKSGNKDVTMDGNGLYTHEAGKLRLAIAIQDLAGDGQSNPSNILFYTGNGNTSVSVGTNVDDTFVIGNDNNGVAGLYKFNKGLSIQSDNFRLYQKDIADKPFIFHNWDPKGKKEPQLYVPVPNTGVLGDVYSYLDYVYSYHDTSRTFYSGFGKNAPQEGDLRVFKDGTSGVVASLAVSKRTYSGNSNHVTVTPYGTLGRLTSASKYKLNITPVHNSLELADRLLTVKPKWWFDKTATESLASDLTKDYLSISHDESEPVPVTPIYGLIAEDLVDAGLESYVDYDTRTREVEGIEYDRLWTVLIPKIKQMQDRIDELEKKLAE